MNGWLGWILGLFGAGGVGALFAWLRSSRSAALEEGEHKAEARQEAAAGEVLQKVAKVDQQAAKDAGEAKAAIAAKTEQRLEGVPSPDEVRAALERSRKS